MGYADEIKKLTYISRGDDVYQVDEIREQIREAAKNGEYSIRLSIDKWDNYLYSYFSREGFSIHGDTDSMYPAALYTHMVISW